MFGNAKTGSRALRFLTVAALGVAATGCQLPPYRTKILGSQPAPAGMPAPPTNSSRSRPVAVPEAPVGRFQQAVGVPGQVLVPAMPATPGAVPVDPSAPIAVPGPVPNGP